MSFRLAVIALAFSALALGIDEKGAERSDSKKVSLAKSPGKARGSEHSRATYTPGEGAKLPEDAVEVSPGIWRSADKSGKVWHYRRTPFGLAKFEPEDGPVSPQEESAGIVARDRGDTVEFESRSPFGVRKWTKKKSELDAAERAALKRATPAKKAKE